MQKSDMANENIALAKQIKQIMKQTAQTNEFNDNLHEKVKNNDTEISDLQKRLSKLKVSKSKEDQISQLKDDLTKTKNELLRLTETNQKISSLLSNQENVQQVLNLHENLLNLQKQLEIHQEIKVQQEQNIRVQNDSKQEYIQQQKDIQNFVFKCKQEKVAQKYKILGQFNRVNYEEAIKYWQ